MELEDENDTDILLSSLIKSLSESTNPLHKKAIILTNSLHQSIGQNELKGYEGLRKYANSLIAILSKFQNAELSEEDILNFEAAIFTLSVCLHKIPSAYLRNKNNISKIISIIKFALNDEMDSYYSIQKSIINIIENILFSRNNNELSDSNDEINKFYINTFIIILEKNLKNNQTCKNLRVDLNKSICKIIREKGNEVKYTILKNIIEFIREKIDKMKDDNYDIDVDNDNDNDNNNDEIDKKIVSKLSQTEGEFIINFLSSLINFLPFDIVNDIIFTLYDLIDKTEIIQFLTSAFLCLDVAFSTKKFALETSEKFLILLLNKNIILQEKKESKFHSQLVVSYIKAIKQILLSLSTINHNQSLKYFIATLALFGELLNSGDDFISNSLFISIQDLMNKLLKKKALDNLFTPNSSISKKEDDINFEISLENLNNQNDKYNGDFILEKITKALLFLISSRYENNKIGFNLLLSFEENINKCAYKENINKINENIMMSLSEKEEKKSEMLKIFIGKSFNSVPCSIILKYFPLGILDYDIVQENYTESSNVWIISFMDKFLKEETQSIYDYVECFMNIINELEYMISKLKKAKIAKKEDMMMDEDDSDNDERLELDKNDTKHLREVKIKRYQLILTQLFSQVNKFTNKCDNYDQYIDAFLTKFEGYFNQSSVCYFDNLKNIVFRFLYKVIKVAEKFKDEKTIELLKNKGIFFFQKILNLILSSKLNKSELQEGFNVISEFCNILNEATLHKIICEMVERFDNMINSEVFTTKSNSNNNNQNKNSATLDKIDKTKEKEGNKLLMRLEIINYLLKKIPLSISNPSNLQNNNDNKNNISLLLFQFFEKYFFLYYKSNQTLYQNISKKLFDIFHTILNKINDIDYTFEIISKFSQQGALNAISSKQQIRLFEIFTNITIKKFTPISFPFEQFKSHFSCLNDIEMQTKSMNKKVRNSSYEILGELTKFLTEKSHFIEWVKFASEPIQSNKPPVISAGINSLSRIFWENRNKEGIAELISLTIDQILPHFSSKEKEILKSLFIYIRVLLFIIKCSKMENKDEIIKKVLYSSLENLNVQMQKEFKVKIRNLIKNVILNFGVNKVRESVPDNYKQLVQYVNKHLVKKIIEINKEVENVHGYSKEELDDSVMLDNEENLIDEEEEFIKKEFKKEEKKNDDKEKKITEKINNLNLYDDDIDEMREKEKKDNEKQNPKAKQLDKIEELFVKDNVELNNFFYVNPYVSQVINEEQKKDKEKDKDKDKDVKYDLKQGKFIIKDIEKEMQVAKEAKRKKKEMQLKSVEEEKKPVHLLMKKRVQNVAKDNREILDESYEDEDGKKNSKGSKKMKITENQSKNIKKKDGGHYVKYSGDEYKNKKGKGDKLIQGKYEPFAYIQLNPKSNATTKGKKSNLKIFQDIMKNDNKK